jgi:hypothetical protein
MNPSTATAPTTEIASMGANNKVNLTPAGANGQPTNQPNFIERMLPTAGAILGGIVGLPGDLLGGAGSIAGASGGDVLGRFIENKLTGQGGGNDLVSSAIEGGAGQLGGNIIGGVLKGAGGAASKLMDTGASKLFSAQGPGIGEDIANFATQHLGINDLPTAAKFGEVISGSTDPLSNADKGLVSKYVEDVAKQDNATTDLSNLQPAIKGSSKAAQISQSSASARNIGVPGTNITEQLISDSGLNGTNEANGLRSQINGVLGRTDNPGSVSKSDLLGMQKQIGGMAADASKAAARSGASVDAAKAKVLNGVNAQLKSSLGFDTMKVTPEDAQALAGDIMKNGSPVSKSAATTVTKDITDQASSEEGLTVGQLRNMESNMVKLQNSAKDAIAAKDKSFGASTSDMLNSTLPVAGAVAKGNPAGLLAAAAGRVTASPAIDKVGSKVLSGLSDVVGKASASKIVPALVKSGAIAATNLPNDIPATSGVSPTGAVNPSAANNTGGTMQGTSQQNDILSIYNTLLQQAQAPGAALLPNYGSMVSALTTLAPLAQKYQAASSIINNLTSGYANAGGAQGPLAGALTKATGVIPGTAASTYNTEQGSAAATIAQLLGISPQSATGMLPQLTQAPTVAAPQYQTLQSIFGGAGG